MLKKINLLNLTILMTSVLLISLASFYTLSYYNNENNHRYLLAAGKLIARRMEEGASPLDAAHDAMEVFGSDQMAFRVTIVNREGQVLYDNEADSSRMENHRFREEIAIAFQNESVGYAVRRSDTLDTEMIYVAQFVKDLDLAIRTAIPVYQNKAILRDMGQTLLLVIVMTFLLLITLSVLANRHLSFPLRQITVAAAAIANGQYDKPVLFEHDDDEVALLGKAINQMAMRIQKTICEINDRNERLDIIINTVTDPVMVVGESCTITFMNKRAKEVFGGAIDPEMTACPLIFITQSQAAEDLVRRSLTEKQAVQAELCLQTLNGPADFQVIASPVYATSSDRVILTLHDVTEAKKLQQMRSDFVANVTHELKTPLTSIRGFVETLRSGAIKKPEVADRFLEFIDVEAERLHQLIKDILILSEIENKETDPDDQTFDLRALIDDVAVMLDDFASASQVTILVPEDESPFMVQANPNRIRQILINLTDNAIKYNHPGGRVSIDVNRDPDGFVVLTVSDTGIGIGKEHLDRLFERFYRIDAGRSSDQGGTGLGLSIVKHIAKLYGGYATVSSTKGEGSIFKVYLKI